jgi:hypothetical protein
LRSQFSVYDLENKRVGFVPVDGIVSVEENPEFQSEVDFEP